MIQEIVDSLAKSPGMGLCDPLKDIPEGMVMEFGVATGGTINNIARSTDRKVYGFDSFKGLPEVWRDTYQVGHFACDIPSVEQNVELVVGLFDESLPKFLEEHEGPVAFIHIDCDLYSSTKTVFNHLKDRMVDGTVIAFDEIRSYGGFEEHEIKAFVEFLQETGYKWECIGNQGGEQGIFRIRK